MATESDNTIEALLEQRAQYEQWLAKLDSTADKAPPAVRQKVRADYQARLQGVIERLRGHAATIAEELHRHQATQSELDTQRRQAEEELAVDAPLTTHTYRLVNAVTKELQAREQVARAPGAQAPAQGREEVVGSG